MITVREIEDKLASQVTLKVPFLDALNEVNEQFITSGKWAGTTFIATALPVEGTVTLPRRAASALGAQINSHPVGVFSSFHEFVEGGFGELDPDIPLTRLVDAGFWPTQVPQTEAAILRIRSASADDDGKTVRLHGTDSDGSTIFSTVGGVSREGLEIELAYPYVDTDQAILLTSAQKELTQGFVTINDITSTEVQIGSWEPTELVPSYHRYKCGTAENAELNVLCKREFVKLVGMTDLVEPGNLRANKLGLMAVFHEGAANFDEAGKCWGSAYSILNSDLKHKAGNEKKAPTPYFPWGRKRMNNACLR